MKSRKGCVIGTSLYNEKYGNSAFKLSADTRKAMADAGPASKARGMVAEAEATGRIAEEVEKEDRLETLKIRLYLKKILSLVY